EPEFENYRGLGEHTVESLIERSAVAGEDIAEMTTDEIFLRFRRHLQPDFKEAEPAGRRPAKGPDPVPPDLVKAVASGECVLCAGRGLAAQAGIPTRTAFFEGLVRFAREQRLLDATTAASVAN